MSLLVKTALKKIVALICFIAFISPVVALYLYRFTIQPCIEYWCHLWTGACNCYLHISDKLLKQVCRTVGPSLAASPEPLTHWWHAINWSLFYRYYFGKIISELLELVQLPHSSGRSMCHFNKLHYFSVTIPIYYKDVHISSFFLHTSKLLSSLLAESCPLTFDLNLWPEV